MASPSKKIASPLLENPFQIPKFAVLDTNEDKVTHEHFLGKWHILYFYPKDMTSGCTTEAREFQIALKRFATLDCGVVGVSRDSCSSHMKFSQKEDLSFTLLSDTEGTLCEAFGVWKEKSLYGKKYMGIERSTFLIDPKGLTIAAWYKVKVSGHVDEVLQFARSVIKK